MLHDARQVSAGETIDADLCIVGGGPAGLTIARELSGGDLRICLLESGGVEYDERIQRLAAGETAGGPIHPPEVSRRRQLGGTANAWDTRVAGDEIGLRAGPLDEVDFERRDCVPHSGWPFGLAELEPYYRRAQAVCGLGPYAYDGKTWERPDHARLPFDSGKVVTTVWQFGDQARFTRDYVDELRRARKVTVYLHANAVEIETDESGRTATHVRVRTLAGGEFRVAARAIVLAAGALANARLLLLSSSVHRQGLGNRHDLVGRFFMEHPIVHAGCLVPADRRLLSGVGLYDGRLVDGTLVMGKLGLAPEVRRREGLLNFGMLLLPRHGMHKPEAVPSLKTLLTSAVSFRAPANARAHLRRVAGGLDYIALTLARKATRRNLMPQVDWGPGITQAQGWSAAPDGARRFTVLDGYMLTEQSPDPDNRVTLSETRDELGCPRVKLHWRWDEVSQDSVMRSLEILRREVRRSGIGRFDVERDGDGPRMLYPGQHHHLGTARMHPSPRHGVVDANGRVHDVSNLFVTGGCVFPTGGYINPTLTIVALALRLADHVRTVIASPAGGAARMQTRDRMSAAERGT